MWWQDLLSQSDKLDFTKIKAVLYILAVVTILPGIVKEMINAIFKKPD